MLLIEQKATAALIVPVNVSGKALMTWQPLILLLLLSGPTRIAHSLLNQLLIRTVPMSGGTVASVGTTIRLLFIPGPMVESALFV